MAERPAGRVRQQSPRIAATSGWDRFLSEPRNAVWLILGAVLAVGGGRRLLQAWRAREAVGRLEGTAVELRDIAAVVEHGRAGLMELFRLLSTADTEPQRHAAGHALSQLWARDELIAEEEKALVRRGFAIDVRARKRYPRALSADIPVTLSYEVPFLSGGGGGVRPVDLEWSHRVVGARRARLESFSPWVSGPIRTTFTIVPSDFESNGPHALVFQVRVRTVGLSDSWELDLPHHRFSFEFDPFLNVEALLALPDEERGAAIGRGVQLASAGVDESSLPRFLPLTPELALRNPPELVVEMPLPGDLAHRLELEFEGAPGQFAAGGLIVSGPANDRGAPRVLARHALGAPQGIPLEAPIQPGRRRLRAILSADPHRGWADPAVRSLWPGTIETNWAEVEVVRL